jgi:hypothetical protein
MTRLGLGRVVSSGLGKRTSVRSTVLAATLGSLILVALAFPASATSLPMVGSQWAVYDLVGKKIVTTHASTIPAPGTGVQFPFPNAAGSPKGYVLLTLDTYSVSLSTSNTLTATVDVVLTSTGAATYVGNPNGGCPTSSPSTCPGAVRLFFQSVQNSSSIVNCAGSHKTEFNYWWSNNGVAAIAGGMSGGYYQFTDGMPTGPAGTSTGTITLSVALDPSQWSDLCGHYGDSGPVAMAGFLAAVAKIKYLGLSFGSGYFFENGVGLDYVTGTANFQLTSFTTS